MQSLIHLFCKKTCDDINNEIQAEKRKLAEELAKKITKELEKGRDKFKDGDTYEFWSNDSNNINIDLKF